MKALEGYAEFKNPPAEYGPLPFWFWNEHLEEDKLQHQLQLMADQHLGGYFIHARTGLETPYLGEKWLELTRTTAKASHEVGLEVWLYDEDNWPSGFAGGRVSGKGEEFLQRFLVGELFPLEEGQTRLELPAEHLRRLISVFAAYEPGPEPSRFAPLEVDVEGESLLLPEGHYAAILVCYVELFDLAKAQEAHITNGYVDTLNPKVVEAFIGSTHEVYERVVGDLFGTVIPGIFTDEPSYRAHSLWERTSKVPWTAALPEIFERERGYSLLEQLPALFFDTTGCEKVRLDFYRTVSDLFVESYTRKLYEWCKAHGLEFTGHFLLEVPFRMSTRVIGSVMHHYEYMHRPGVDHLGREIGTVANPWPTVTMRQLASVGHQLGKKRLMDEIFGCGGYNLTPARQRQMVDWQAALGINMIVPHAFYYTHRGLRKREYPPDDFYSQPWWPYSHKLWDHIRRTSYLVSESERFADVAVLHPLESIWATHRDQDYPWVDERLSWIEDRFLEVENGLNLRFIPHDYLEEGQLARHGEATYDGLRVGKALYKYVIVPPLVTLRKTTIDLLRKFSQQGGELICVEPLPYLMDGEPVEDMLERLHPKRVVDEVQTPEPRDDLLDLLEDVYEARFEIDGATGEELLVQEFLRGEERLFFLVNLTDKALQFTFSVETSAECFELECATGEIKPLPAASLGGLCTLEVHLAPQASKWIRFKPSESERVAPPIPAQTVIAEYAGPFNLELKQSNVLLLDEFEAQFDGQKVSGGKLPVRHLHKLALAEAAKGPFELQLRATFECAVEPKGFAPALAIEQPERWEIWCNSVQVELPATREWLVEAAHELVPLGDTLQEGTNELVLRTRFEPGAELEAVYLAGNFGVSSPPFTLVQCPTELVAGNFASQGLPFYAGTAVCTFDLVLDEVPEAGRLLLDCGRVRDAVKVSVNGTEAGLALWPPFQVEVTGLLHKGHNTITLEVAGDLFNFYGPHHHPNGVKAGTSPSEWDIPLDQYRKEYTLDEFGLLEPCKLDWEH